MYSDSEYDSEDEYEFDDLLTVNDQASADAYIKDAIDKMDPAAKDRVMTAFLYGTSGLYPSAPFRDPVTSQIPVLSTAQIPVQSGGDDLRRFHDMLYDLLQLEDSLHDDFGDITTPRVFSDKGLDMGPLVTATVIMNQLNVTLPVITKTRVDPDTKVVSVFDEIMKVEEMHGPDNTFILDITGSPTLQFADLPAMDNPLHGLNLEQGMFDFKEDCGTVTEQYAARPAPCKNCVNAEIWCFGDHGVRGLKHEQIAAVSGDIREFFGPRAVFVVDESIPVTRLVLGLEPIYKSFLKSYRLEDMPGVIRSREQTRADTEWHTLSKKVRYGWTAVSCDAGLMDAGMHAFPLHSEPTGDVFRDGARVQVTLLGTEGESYRYALSSVCNPVDYEKTYACQRTVTGVKTLEYSKSFIAGQVVSEVQNGKNVSTLLALKRAGDWGQVEHCKRYGYVFVTADKPAALYAIFRDVCVLFVKTHKTMSVVAEEYGDKRDLYRHSFALYGTPEARAKLTFSNDGGIDLTQKDFREYEQDGGNFKSTFSPTFLACVTVAMAIVQSLV